MLIRIVGIAHAKTLMLHLTAPATSKRQKGGVATYPLLATRRFHQRCLGIATEPTMLAGNRLGFHAVVHHRLPFVEWGGVQATLMSRSKVHPTPDRSMLGAHRHANLTPSRWPRPSRLPRAHAMSQLSKMKRSRDQWKQKAKQRGDHNRYQRKQIARLRAERNHATKALQETQAQLRQLEAERHAVATRSKVEVVSLALHLFLVARLRFRAVCRVLSL